MGTISKRLCGTISIMLKTFFSLLHSRQDAFIWKIFIFSFIGLSHFCAIAQELPSQCIQLPQRTTVCPNLLYKRAPVDIPNLTVKQGDLVCVCMADFIDLRLAATTEQGKIDQLVSLSRASNRLNISETELLALLRK